MRDFVFENKTKIYFGKEQMCHLHEEVARFGKRVLMVYGGGSIKRTGLYDRVMAELQKAGMEVYELPGVEPNPHHTTVNRGAAICKKEGIDVLLAVGGGSTIDATKGIAAAAKYEGDDVWDLVTQKAAVTETCHQQCGDQREIWLLRSRQQPRRIVPRPDKHLHRQPLSDGQRQCRHHVTHLRRGLFQ